MFPGGWAVRARGLGGGRLPAAAVTATICCVAAAVFGVWVGGLKCVLHELAAGEHPLDGFMCNGELCMTVVQQQHRL